MPARVTNNDVNRALREIVWPDLTREGFDRRTGRTAWRDHPDQVDVVTFWSHNAYNAGVFRINTISFQLHLGVHPRCRTTDETAVKDGALRPQEAACDFRRVLVKPLVQEETDRPEIWFVRSDGSNLQEIVEAARNLLLDEGLAWFTSLGGLHPMLETARYEPLTPYTAGGMGNLGSPHRLSLIADLEAAAPR
jgi:hypothetical protein